MFSNTVIDGLAHHYQNRLFLRTRQCQAMSGNITNGISSLSTSELALTPTPNAKPSCQLLVLMHVPSSQQTSIVPETHLHKKMNKKCCV